MVECDGRGGVAGNDRKPWLEALDEAAEEGGYPAGDLGLAAAAVGEAGAVGRVDDRRVGKERSGRAEHGQAADS